MKRGDMKVQGHTHNDSYSSSRGEEEEGGGRRRKEEEGGGGRRRKEEGKGERRNVSCHRTLSRHSHYM